MSLERSATRADRSTFISVCNAVDCNWFNRRHELSAHSLVFFPPLSLWLPCSGFQHWPLYSSDQFFFIWLLKPRLHITTSFATVMLDIKMFSLALVVITLSSLLHLFPVNTFVVIPNCRVHDFICKYVLNIIQAFLCFEVPHFPSF